MAEFPTVPQDGQPTENQQPAISLGPCVAALVNAVTKGMAEETAPYDLIPVEFSLLKNCMDRGQCTATQLAEVLPMDASRISRVVNRLVTMGLLRRRRLTSDRRVVMLTLTPKGHELTRNLDERVQMYDAKLVRGVSEARLRAFANTISKIVDNHAKLKSSQ